MNQTEAICDVPIILCKGGKKISQCGRLHDVCSLCIIKIGNCYYCPLCVDLQNGRIR